MRLLLMESNKSTEDAKEWGVTKLKFGERDFVYTDSVFQASRSKRFET